MTERSESFGPGEDDEAIRLAAFAFVESQLQLHGDTIPRTVLAQGFQFLGRRVPIVGPQGIFKPALLKDIPLSITTVPLVPGRERPYEDELGADGRLTYHYRETHPDHADNRGLRLAMARRTPLIYLFGITPGQYLPAWPVFVVEDDRRTGTFKIEIDTPGSLSTYRADGSSLSAEPQRRYVTAIVYARVHQVVFRRRVIEAYREQCAVCRLRHSELLDAAHILPDGHPKGEPVVRNGLALCKLHHAAFDGHILGVRPDLVVEIREDILREKDGPMLQHGLQGFQGGRIDVPGSPNLKPATEFLEERYALFRKAS
jgi:putative restriction endonuclease